MNIEMDSHLIKNILSLYYHWKISDGSDFVLFSIVWLINPLIDFNSLSRSRFNDSLDQCNIGISMEPGSTD